MLPFEQNANYVISNDEKLVKTSGGVMVICGLHDLAKDLLHITALDTLWAIYETREEALESIGA
jgi:anti-sigma B factor antagonist